MDEEDYSELLRHVVTSMRELGMSDLVSRLMVAVDPNAGPPSRQLLQMLDALEEDFRLQDVSTVRRITARFGEVVRTSEGEPPQGIWLDFAPGHRDLFGLDGVDLGEGPDLGLAIRELNKLRSAMREDLGGRRRR